MKEKYINAHMKVAETYASLSTAVRLKVGAIVVKDDRIISIGYNGMPSGWDNNCEDEIGDVRDVNDNVVEIRLKSKPEVLHAERNAIDKLARLGGVGSAGAAMFTTHAPCLECSKSIYGAGITEVFYGEDYRSEDGIFFLKKCGVNIVKISKRWC